MPVAFAIAVSGFAFFLTRPEIPWTILVQRSLSTTQSFTMLAIPLFIFAGNLMNNTGITSRPVSYTHLDVYKRQEFSRTVFQTPDCAEGVDAFIHKRQPEFGKKNV